MLANGAAVSKRSVTLGDKIGMNLYLTLSEKVLKTEGAAVVISVDGKEAEEIPVADLIKEADGTYKVTALLRSIDMTKNVTVSFKGTEELGTYTTSVYDYLKALDKKSTNANEKALIVAMKNYGAYAQEYFAKKNGTEAGLLANRDLLSARCQHASASSRGQGFCNFVSPSQKAEKIRYCTLSAPKRAVRFASCSAVW